MEGGNKTLIDLEAGLDITSSDMLTPLSGVTFQHNWQKYQGRFFYLTHCALKRMDGQLAGMFITLTLLHLDKR